MEINIICKNIHLVYLNNQGFIYDKREKVLKYTKYTTFKKDKYLSYNSYVDNFRYGTKLALNFNRDLVPILKKKDAEIAPSNVAICDKFSEKR